MDTLLRDFGEDARLVQRAQAGDRAAFALLASGYRELVEAVVRRQGCEDVDDLAQEAFARAWEGLQGLKDAQAFPAWLSTLTTNLCKRWQQRYACRKHQPLDENLAPAGGDPLETLLRREQSLGCVTRCSPCPRTTAAR